MNTKEQLYALLTQTQEQVQRSVEILERVEKIVWAAYHSSNPETEQRGNDNLYQWAQALKGKYNENLEG